MVAATSVVAEGVTPVGKDQVAGDDDRAGHAAAGDELEDQARRRPHPGAR